MNAPLSCQSFVASVQSARAVSIWRDLRRTNHLVRKNLFFHISDNLNDQPDHTCVARQVMR